MNNKNFKVFTVSAFVLLLAAILIQGCSKVEENVVTAPTVSSHPVGWIDTNSTDFHGKYLLEKKVNLILCSPCHGPDFKGGTSKVSCYKCHSNLVVHPKGWYLIDSASSPSFHSNYLFQNHLDINSCRQCHGINLDGGLVQKSCYRCHEISTIHNSLWYNSLDTVNFHGRYILANGWNLDDCKNCHGTDYQGGVSQKTCYRCHTGTGGPEACYTCHGNANTQYYWPPKSLYFNMLNTQQGVGAHDVHLNPDSNLRVSRGVQCSECHRTVINFSDTNHIGNNPGTAEVVFGTLAKTVTSGYTPNPIWNKSTQTCSNVYCHGYFKNGNTTAVATFTNPGSVVCGSCHGNPTTGDPTPGGHSTYPPNCNYCHSAVINANRNIINKSRHINGVIDYNVQK